MTTTYRPATGLDYDCNGRRVTVLRSITADQTSVVRDCKTGTETIVHYNDLRPVRTSARREARQFRAR
jgi:hypothetical protein